jgi:hypothetical protein
MAYVQKPTQIPVATKLDSNISGDTRMSEGTAEEEKKSTQPDRTSD